MELQAWLVVAVVVLAFLMLVVSCLSAHVVLLSALVVLIISSLVSPEAALAGFGSSGLWTIAALYVVVAGVRQTGVLDWLGPFVTGGPAREWIGRLRIMLPTAGASAFLNNTPVVALFIPMVSDWCRRYQMNPSRFMLPLSYAAILGGTCTLLGSSTNVLIAGMMGDMGDSSLGMFTPALIGVPVLIVAFIVMLVTAPWLLPQHKDPLQHEGAVRQFTVELVVAEASAVAGQTIEDAGLRHLHAAYLIAVMRGGVDLGLPQPGLVLQGGDRLVFSGERSGVNDLASRKGLTLAAGQRFRLETPSIQRMLIEVVLPERSSLIGKSVNDAGFRTRFQSALVALSHAGERVSEGIGDYILRPGDILLLETVPEFIRIHGHSGDFYIVAQPDHESLRNHQRAPIAFAILIGMMVLATTGLLSILSAALAAAGAMLVSGCCSLQQARSAIDVPLLVVIGAAFGLGAALDQSGAVVALAETLLYLVGSHPWWSLAAVYLATVLLTETITNNAAAIIMWPIAFGITEVTGVNPLPFALAIMVAASASFLSSFGYHTNLMVAGPGGYRFVDYLRFGFPVAVTVAVVTLGLLPIIFPFTQIAE